MVPGRSSDSLPVVRADAAKPASRGSMSSSSWWWSGEALRSSPHVAQRPAQSVAAERRDRLGEGDRLAHRRLEVELVVLVDLERVRLLGEVDRRAGRDVERRQRLLVDLDVDGRDRRVRGSGCRSRRGWCRTCRGRSARGPSAPSRTSPTTGAASCEVLRDRQIGGRDRYVVGAGRAGRFAQQSRDVIAEHARAARRRVGRLRGTAARCRPPTSGTARRGARVRAGCSGAP